MMSRCLAAIAMAAVACSAVAADNLVRNGDFESARVVKGAGSSDTGFGAWTVGGNALAPKHWVRNSAYPGTLTVLSDGAHSGKSFVRIAGSNAKRSAHIFQPVSKLKPGGWYKVSAWIRGGKVSVGFYEYYQKGPIRAPTICLGNAGLEWRQIAGYYMPAGEGFKSASLFVQVHRGQRVDIDDVCIELLPQSQAPVGKEPIVIENDLVRMKIAPTARLASFVCKATGQDYADPTCPMSMLQARVNGMNVPALFLKQDGNAIRVQFADPQVKARIRIEPKGSYFVAEVLDAQPADMERIEVQFPLKRLANQSGAFCANYGDAFATCCFALDLSGQCFLRGMGRDVVGLRCVSMASRGGVKGAKFALVACPREQFNSAIQQVERDNGLPCPMLDGKWVRESEPIRRSYLFVIGMEEKDTDALIDYAKVGGFQMIIILKNSWLKTHGHYQINEKYFPDGLASFKRTVDKIHAAGLKAGVHVFGPSISPNDPYVTPVPDDRLLSVECPPLAEAVDAKAKVLTLAAQPTTLPPAQPRTRSFPGYYLRIGDEIVRYADVEVGPPFRFIGCRRGACGTTATAHDAGATVRGMLTTWGFFDFDPDSTLLDEVTSNFARIVNECKLDMVYFDASEGARLPYMDGYYYVAKSHLAFYRKFDHGVLYQTSMGTGRGMIWHFVARSASADGHGDIKWYLDQRLNGILRMRKNFTFADIGWYGLDPGSRVDRLEYVAARCLGCGGSISVQCNRTIFETHPHARQIMEMLSRYERCRLAKYFPDSVRAKLLEKGQEFKLYEDGKRGWSLFHAAYEPDRVITKLDGKQNVWSIENDRGAPCRVAIEITRDVRYEAGPDYDSPDAMMIEDFEDMSGYATSERNQFAKFVQGAGRTVTPQGVVRNGTTMQFTQATDDARVGKACAVYTATNSGVEDGWTGIGKRFDKPIDLSGRRGLAMWVHGDAKNAVLMVQLWDTAGRHHHWRRKIGHKGWKLLAFPIAPNAAIDWTKIDYLLFYYNNIPTNTTVTCKLDGLKALPGLATTDSLTGLALTVNGERVELPGALGKTETLETNGLGECTIWPGGMKPGRRAQAPQTAIMLKPGRNDWSFTCALPEGKQPDVNIRLIRLWPVAE